MIVGPGYQQNVDLGLGILLVWEGNISSAILIVNRRFRKGDGRFPLLETGGKEMDAFFFILSRGIKNLIVGNG